MDGVTALERLPARTKDGKGLHVVVESPRGSHLKLKYEPELGAFTLSRPLPEGLSYPYDWGFIPGTRAADGDPLDALVYWNCTSVTGLVLPCRPIGVVKLEQDGARGRRERNDRLILVPLKSARLDAIDHHRQISRRRREEIAHFFVSAVYFENKNPRVLGWSGPETARRLFESCVVE